MVLSARLCCGQQGNQSQAGDSTSVICQDINIGKAKSGLFDNVTSDEFNQCREENVSPRVYVGP